MLSVSPVLDESGDAVDSGSEIDADMEGMSGERLKLPKEEEAVKKLRDARLPLQEDVDKHYLMGHMKFRDWCPVCVRSRGREMDHTRDKRRERSLSGYSFDYCVPGDELGCKWTVLVGRERGHKS